MKEPNRSKHLVIQRVLDTAVGKRFLADRITPTLKPHSRIATVVFSVRHPYNHRVPGVDDVCWLDVRFEDASNIILPLVPIQAPEALCELPGYWWQGYLLQFPKEGPGVIGRLAMLVVSTNSHNPKVAGYHTALRVLEASKGAEALEGSSVHFLDRAAAEADGQPDPIGASQRRWMKVWGGKSDENGAEKAN